NELEESVSQNIGKFDYITFVGSGEPTLCKSLGKLILKAKEYSNKPVCVITNGALLYTPEVRKDLMNADVVLPSLDAGDEKSFIRINRPHPSITYDKMIDGLRKFKNTFNGNFWIETMIIKGINDSKEELLKIKEKIDLIKPDRIDINVPIRPPVEKWVEIPDRTIISLLNEVFEEYRDIAYPEMGVFGLYSEDFKKELLNILERHPMRQDQIIETFRSVNFTEDNILLKLNKLESDNYINKWLYHNKIFWKLTSD
ncbi:unnamed protein product, partial [marine sediment metagenome]